MIGASARGPFLLLITRPGNKPGFHKTEWLSGEVERSDVETDAQALLTDPRDTIESVLVWSLKDQQFVGGFRPEGGSYGDTRNSGPGPSNVGPRP